jgi:hypothetical protein
VPYDTDGLLLSLAMAPSDPNRLYITGLFATTFGENALVSGVLVSSDAGKTWERTDISAPPGSSVYVAGVDPTNADNVYVRFEKLNQTSSELTDSWVLYSSDAGKTFSEILRKKAILFAFTFTPDNSRVMVGFGDPQGPINVEKADLGLWAATPGSSSFTQVHAAHIACLTFVGKRRAELRESDGARSRHSARVSRGHRDRRQVRGALGGSRLQRHRHVCPARWRSRRRVWRKRRRR